MIDKQNVFDQPVKNDLRKYSNIRKIVTGQRDDYITGCLLMVQIIDLLMNNAIDLSKKQTFDTDPKNTANQFYWKSRLNRKCNNTFPYCRSTKKHFSFFTRNNENIVNVFCFNIISA